MKVPMHEMKFKIPDTEEYRPLLEVFDEAVKHGGKFIVNIDDRGTAIFSCGDKRAVIHPKDSMYEMLLREWYGYREN
jgi:hypothetical protein